VYYWNNVRPLDKTSIKLLMVVKDELKDELFRKEKKNTENEAKRAQLVRRKNRCVELGLR
jgi:hypothetical protein